MLATLLTLHRKDGVIATYHVECEVNVDEFMKEVTHTVYFNEAECEVKCSCALFKMRGILCRHVLGIMKVNKVRSVPEKYILDRWRKDIKMTYTLIRSSYDLVDQRPEVSRYSRIIKKCYEVATNASSCDEHTEDMLAKLDAMNLGYRTNLLPSKVVVIHADTTTDVSSKKVLSPHVVRGKGRPPSLRKKSMIEKVKPTTKKASQKGKRKQFEHPKNARPGFRQVFDVLSEAGKSTGGREDAWVNDEAFFKWKDDLSNYEDKLKLLRVQKVSRQLTNIGNSILDLQAPPQGLAALLSKVSQQTKVSCLQSIHVYLIWNLRWLFE
ncbi:protein FAR1-RELATED SEQUENCE 2-like [Carya illinoinensis]|uniref:protein FAR1-RELATED SEQUENCE 2-like n=1 Tax=Carya illinoinensis TaxID=32201 RepID=UPI001C7208FF|nr:protein FAR1-RELATED SEQUENCE 2-like [Carya illinoinensis]